MSQRPGREPENPRPKITRRSRKRLTSRAFERMGWGWARLLETPALWVALFLVVGTWLLAPRLPAFVSRTPVGSIAARDYVAPRDLWLLDEVSTLERQRRAREEVLPVYDFDASVVRARENDFQNLFAEGRALLEQRPEEPKRGPAKERAGGAGTAPEVSEGGGLTRAQQLAERLQAISSSLRVTPEQIGLLMRLEFAPDLEERLRSLMRQALHRGVVGNKEVLLEHRIRGVVRRDLESGKETVELDLYDHLGHPDELREFLEAEVRNWSGLKVKEGRLLVDLLVANLRPNFSFNQSDTLARQEAAAASVERVYNQVRKGQVVVRKGDEVSPMAARVIAEIAGERRWDRLALPLVGVFALLLLVTVALWLGLDRERVAEHSRRRLLSEGLILLLLSLLGSKFFFVVAEALSGAFDSPPFKSLESYRWAVPYAVLALLTGVLCNRNLAMMLSLLFSILVSRLAGDEALPVLIFSIAGSMAAVFAVDQFQLKQRVVMARIGLLVGLVNVLMVLLWMVAAGEIDRGPSQIGFDLLCAFAGGLLTAAVASFALPILESLFGITTDIKLIELANTNLPLLRRLAFEAPGTFQHSLMVANLAKEGCESIGADAVMAYTGALYHDVGKVFRPDYFIENQRTGINPHDKLQPSMSALILINHIKEGVELARSYHLPQPILDAIEQHHGNRLITFFYKRALEHSAPDTGEVREEEYRYPGPRPRNKVMGVLMLADGVEAASRTLIEPTPAKIRSLIRTLVDDCLKDGQLDLTDLTLSDLKKVSDAFLRVLSNIYHQRVDYPGFDFNAEPKRERLAATAS